MSTRLRTPGGGSKLVRPVPLGTGMKSPLPRGVARPSPGPPGDREGPPTPRTVPVGGQQQKRPPAQARLPPVARPPQESSAELSVGDSVLVAGVKPGVVAFVGPTQFAPGVWAGVILDSYDGKNNGSVKGVSYFQCEPNRGLFSRLDKLTLVQKAASRAPPPQGQRSAPPPRVSFDIGDRVVVDGSKLGTIGFIGETQFARGVWAGVILDEPEGKNNGQVNGVQYFDSPPNHGIFTRPQKLFHAAENADTTTPTPSVPSPQVSVRSVPRDTVSQERNSRVQPSVLDLKALQEKLKLGDHVLVGGVKEGRLRYLGPTEFAKGIWAGVELPEPMGKNDGAVSGKRYFQCAPKHGIFAPLPKIEKLATASDSMSSMSGASLLSKSPTPPPLPMSMPSPPGTIRIARGHPKQRSESSTSSFGVQEHRVSSLAGSTAASLAHLLQQREENITELKGDLLVEKNKHLEEATKLTRQVEDLQFQLLELGVISGDQLEQTAESSQERLASLVTQLEREKQRVRDLEAQVMQPNDEKSQERLASLAAQLEGEKQRVRDLEAQVMQPNDESSQERLASLATQLEREKQRVRDLEAQLQQAQQLGSGSTEETETLRSQLIQTQTELEDQRRELATQLETVSKLDSERAAAVQSGEELSQTVSQREEEVVNIRLELGSVRNRVTDLQQSLKTTEDQCKLLTQQKASLEEQMNQLSHMSGDSSQQLTFMQDQLRDKESKFEELHTLNSSLSSQLESMQSNQTQQDTQLSLLQEQLVQERQRASSLESEITQTSVAATDIGDELQRTHADLKDAMELCSQHEALLEERNNELNTLDNQVRQLSQAREQLSNEKSRLQSDSERIVVERDRAIAECDRLMAARATSSSEQTELSRQRGELLAERDQLLGQQQALQTENEKLMGERDEVMHQLAKIQSDRQEAILNSQELNSKFENTNMELTDALSEIEELRLELSRSRDNWEHEKLSLREQIELAGDSGAELRARIEHACSERDSALQQAQELMERLDTSERDKDQVQLSLERAQAEIDELNYQMEELNIRYATLEQDATVISERLESAEGVLGEREGQLVQAREEIQTLTEDLKASQGKTDHAILEEEKLLLEERVRELTTQLERAQEKKSPARRSAGKTIGAVDNATLTTQLAEARSALDEHEQNNLDLQQQIDFLNSVIADLQRKLETAEAMSGLHGPLDTGDEYIEDDDDLLQGLPPPRLFCDICDVFDVHDTDDCPLQAGSDSPPPSTHHGVRAPGGSDRPYCTNCEMFGHATEECEFEATY